MHLLSFFCSCFLSLLSHRSQQMPQAITHDIYRHHVEGADPGAVLNATHVEGSATGAAAIRLKRGLESLDVPLQEFPTRWYKRAKRRPSGSASPKCRIAPARELPVSGLIQQQRSGSVGESIVTT